MTENLLFVASENLSTARLVLVYGNVLNMRNDRPYPPQQECYILWNDIQIRNIKQMMPIYGGFQFFYCYIATICVLFLLLTDALVPRLQILRINPHKMEIGSFRASDFELIGYDPYERIDMKMAVQISKAERTTGGYIVKG